MLLGPLGFIWCFSFAPELHVVSYLAPRDLHRRAAHSIYENNLDNSGHCYLFLVGSGKVEIVCV